VALLPGRLLKHCPPDFGDGERAASGAEKYFSNARAAQLGSAS